MSRLVLTMIFIVPTVRKNIMQLLGTATVPSSRSRSKTRPLESITNRK